MVEGHDTSSSDKARQQLETCCRFKEGRTSPPSTQITQLQRRNWAIDPHRAAKDNKRLGALTDAKKQIGRPLLNPTTPKTPLETKG